MVCRGGGEEYLGGHRSLRPRVVALTPCASNVNGGAETNQPLREIGVMPEDIEIVILIHLHWDHASNNGLFKNATFLVQKKELEYASSPLPVHLKGYEAPQSGMRPHYLGVKYTVTSGDYEVVPGVSTILTPGHSPGSQCVAVETEKGV